MTSAIEAAQEQWERELDERSFHRRMQWFFEKYAPADKRDAAEFHADLAIVMDSVYRHASRETHALLAKAMAVIPVSLILPKDVEKP